MAAPAAPRRGSRGATNKSTKMYTRDLLALLCVLLAWGASVADSGTDRSVSAWHWPTNHTGSNRNRRQVAASAFEPISMTASPSALPQAPPEVIAPDDDEDGLLAWNWMIGSDAATKRNPSHRSANFQRYPMVRTEKPPWMPRPLPESAMKTDTVPRDFYPSTIDDYHLVFNRLNDSGFVRISTQRIYSKHQLENHNLRQVFWLCQAQWNTVNLGCNWFPQLIREATCDNPSCSGPDFKCKPIAAFQKMLRRKNGLCRTDSEMSYEPLGVDATRTVWDLPAELRDEWVWEKRRVPIACACNGEFMEWPWDQIL